MAKYGLCTLCGKKAKRYCPALKKDICSYCCASKRNDSIKCLPECKHNLFGTANYQRWLDFERKWDYKFANEYVKTHPENLNKAIQLYKSDNIEEDEIMNIVIHLAACYIRDENGKSYIDYFADEFANQLGNDGLLYMHCLQSIRPSIFEVQKVINRNSIKCLDLLDPEHKTFIITDNCFTKIANRFGKYLVWKFDLPCFSRLVCSVFKIESDIYDYFINSIEEIADENDRNITDTIAMHYGDVVDALFAAHDIKRQKFLNSFRNMDLKECTIRYNFSCPLEQIEDIMDEKPDFDFNDIDPESGDPENTLHYTWHRKGESKKFDKKSGLRMPFGVGILANVKLMPGILEIRTMSEAKKDFAKKMAEKFFANLITFDKELVVDIAKQFADDNKQLSSQSNITETKTNNSPNLSPEVEEEVMNQLYKKRYKKFLDEKIPAIDNMTPKEAMSDPDMRPQLIELMKGHVHNIDSLAKEKNINLNIDWVLEELSLDELL